MHKKRRKAYRNLINALLNCNEGEEWQLLEEHPELLDAHFIKLMQKVAEELKEKGDEEGANFLWYLADALVDLEMIAQLLNCASDEEVQQVLNANRELVDAGLVQMMIQAAEALEEEGDRNRANFLINLARQLAEFLGISGNVAADNSSPAATPEEYLNFLMEVLHVTSDSKGDPDVVYPLLQRNLDKLDEFLARGLQGWGSETLAKVEPEQANELAAVIFDFSNLIQQFSLDNRLSNLEITVIGYEIAVTGYELVLTVFSREDFPKNWAGTKNNLGIAYWNRIKGDRRENIEQAITCYQDALQVYTREALPQKWAMTKNNLGNAYSERIEGDRRENIEDAIAFFRDALEVRTREALPLDWASTKNNLGAAYNDRIEGDRGENIEQAIAYFLDALEVYTREALPQDWARTKNNLGTVYCNRIEGDRGENIEQAIACFRDALEVCTREALPLDWASTKNNLGIAYRNRIEEDRGENIEDAIACFRNALEVRTREALPLDWASTKNNLGIAYSDRIEGDRGENIEDAIACFRDALQVLTREAIPLNCLQTRLNLGDIYFIQENWQKAIESYQIAIEIVEDTRLLSIDENRKQEIIAENIGVFANIIHCYSQLEQYEKAIEYLERSKTRNLVELIATRDLYPKGDIPQKTLTELDRLRQEIFIEQRNLSNLTQISTSDRGETSRQGSQPSQTLSPVLPDFTHFNQLKQKLDKLIEDYINPIDPEFELTQKVKPITFDQIQELTNDHTAIIQWYITGEEIFTFITTKNSEQPIVKRFSSPDELINQMNDYLNLYRRKNKEDWRTQLPSRLRKFAQILHLDEIISPLKEKYSKIILIPHLYLHLLPLHALPLADDKCLLDHFEEVKYAPSCQLLQLIQKRQRQESNNLFGIQNPTEDLDYTNIEVESISQIFHPHNDIIAKQAATKTALDTKNLQDKHYNHFSCHGYFNFREPLKSALILAGAVVQQEENQTSENKQNASSQPEKTIRSPEDETLDLEKCLTLGDIFELDLRQCRLVTLSACETAITDIESTSDEYISLPSGFLFAGACNVVATQWTVNDLSTAILMIKFYQLHKIDGLPVAKAMNEAQKWLRDGTQEVLWSWTEQLKKDLQLEQNLIEEIQTYLEDFEVEEQPFNEPFYWAAFCAIGK